ncbi:hypothetical protein BCV70DRAFT_111959 [Testicularia cyperi]|uniref:Uncharacterized protein n=1 Tax=Testicularia cyperi TaxID=1882483 RepID=A0A317XN02_9BASI|nr:hypothetical protein BCV70DRAFT_111959 [Testicularia cyperi]
MLVRRTLWLAMSIALVGLLLSVTSVTSSPLTVQDDAHRQRHSHARMATRLQARAIFGGTGSSTGPSSLSDSAARVAAQNEQQELLAQLEKLNVDGPAKGEDIFELRSYPYLTTDTRVVAIHSLSDKLLQAVTTDHAPTALAAPSGRLYQVSFMASGKVALTEITDTAIKSNAAIALGRAGITWTPAAMESAGIAAKQASLMQRLRSGWKWPTTSNPFSAGSRQPTSPMSPSSFAGSAAAGGTSAAVEADQLSETLASFRANGAGDISKGLSAFQNAKRVPWFVGSIPVVQISSLEDPVLKTMSTLGGSGSFLLRTSSGNVFSVVPSAAGRLTVSQVTDAGILGNVEQEFGASPRSVIPGSASPRGGFANTPPASPERLTTLEQPGSPPSPLRSALRGSSPIRVSSPDGNRIRFAQNPISSIHEYDNFAPNIPLASEAPLVSEVSKGGNWFTEGARSFFSGARNVLGFLHG